MSKKTVTYILLWCFTFFITSCSKDDEDNFRLPHMVIHHPVQIFGNTYQLKGSIVSLFGNTVVDRGFFISVSGASDYYVWSNAPLKNGPGKYSVNETFTNSGFYYVYAVSVIEFSNSTDTVWSDYYVPVEIP